MTQITPMRFVEGREGHARAGIFLRVFRVNVAAEIAEDAEDAESAEGLAHGRRLAAMSGLIFNR